MNVEPTLMCVIAFSVIIGIIAHVASKTDEKESGGSKKIKFAVWIPTMATVVVLLTAYILH